MKQSAGLSAQIQENNAQIRGNSPNNHLAANQVGLWKGDRVRSRPNVKGHRSPDAYRVGERWPFKLRRLHSGRLCLLATCRLVSSIGQRDLHVHLLASAEDSDRDRIARVM